jgi:ParB family chromosome partitioning protein
MVTGVRLVREIKIGSRVRTDESAEIDSLAKSIKETGLRHAITIDSNNNLIAGWRRLMSYQRLGWKQIEVNVVDDLNSMSMALSMERDDDTERAPMSNVDLLAYIAAISVLEEPDGRTRRSRGIAEGNRRRFAGLGRKEHLTWAQRAPHEPRTIIGTAIGLSPATTSRVLGIAKRMRSDDPVTRNAAILAQQEIQAGVAIHTAYEKMTTDIRAIKRPERVKPKPDAAPLAQPEPEPESAAAIAYRLRRREEMVTAKFQREIVGQAVATGVSLVKMLTHIAEKLNTYGVNEEITSDETERWLKDIARTRTALAKVARAIKGGPENGETS